MRDNAAAFDNEALIWAEYHGHFEIVNRLLEIPAVVANAAARDNEALREAARYGHFEVVNRLLEIDEVRDNDADFGNEALRKAAENSHLAIVKRLLQVPGVRVAASDLSDEVIKRAADRGCYEIVYRLAKAKWPDGGVQGIPAEMRDYCAGGDSVRVQISRAGAGLFTGENYKQRTHRVNEFGSWGSC